MKTWVLQYIIAPSSYVVTMYIIPGSGWSVLSKVEEEEEEEMEGGVLKC